MADTTIDINAPQYKIVYYYHNGEVKETDACDHIPSTEPELFRRSKVVTVLRQEFHCHPENTGKWFLYQILK